MKLMEYTSDSQLIFFDTNWVKRHSDWGQLVDECQS